MNRHFKSWKKRGRRRRQLGPPAPLRQVALTDRLNNKQKDARARRAVGRNERRAIRAARRKKVPR